MMRKNSISSEYNCTAIIYYTMKRHWMRCIKCKSIKDLSRFWEDYDAYSPLCLNCINKKNIKKETNYIQFIEWTWFRIRVEIILKIKERKNNKKKYPKEFTIKRRILLDYARNNDWCTACGMKEILQVHHIDKNKFNNDDSNLLVLCYYCHSKEHKHMQWKKPAKCFK